MQNWNQQWQVSTGATSGTMPQPPIAPGYPTTGTDPMAAMQANMQYFNQPAPSGYTNEQWAAAQQQNWAQWQQYQQQYQQWQAQYGAKYQETIKQMSASGLSGFPLVSPVMPPPLPKEESAAKPPLPPDNMNSYQSSNMIPPHQNNLPLFSKTSGNPPLPLGQPPPPPDNPPPSNENTFAGTKRSASNSLTSDSAKKSKNEDDELSNAEKTFDAQFKQWEEQFNKWKLQNANHPDKVQYKQYEAKWTSWREKLIERREQMRKKREAQRAKAESEKKKSLPGGDKLLNILTNTENQGLINNLLGIGKTLGLSGKENTLGNVPPQTSTSTGSTTMNVQSAEQSTIAGVPPTMTSDMTQQAWAAQQWAAQYNMASMAVASTYPAYQTQVMTSSTISNQPMVGSNLSNFNQMPPLGMQNTNVNFSQPPPGFIQSSQSTTSQTVLGTSSMSHDGNSQFRRNDDSSNSSFNRRDSYDRSFNDKYNTDRFDSKDNRRSDRDRADQFRPSDSFDNNGLNRFNRDDRNDFGSDNFRNDGSSRDFGGTGSQRGPNNDFRSSDFYGSRDRSSDRKYDDDRGGRNDGRFNDQDQFGGPKNDTFNSSFNRDQSTNDRFRSTNRFSSNDQFNEDRFGNDRHGSDRSLSNDRFSSDRLGPNQNRMDSRDSMDRRDNFGSNDRNVGNNRFVQPAQEEMPAELKKLMEKRRAAIDVFKPSSNFLAPEKSTTNFGSLSESFRRITGDSPFLPKDRPNEFVRDRGSRLGPPDQSRGLGSFGGTDNKSRDEFHDRGPPDLRSRGLGDFNTRLDTSGLRRPNDFGPRGSFGTRGQEPDAGRNRGFGNSNNRSQISPWENQPPLVGPLSLDGSSRDCGNFMNRSGQSRGNQSPPHSHLPDKLSVTTVESEKSHETIIEPEQNTPPLEMPPWMDPQMMSNPINDGDSANLSTKESQPMSDDKTQEKSTVNQKSNEPIKKPDGLPFMGENDPKPEDLNMEPPPELPDLGPIKSTDPMPFDTRGPGATPENSNIFDENFSAKGMLPKSKGPDSLSNREPENDRFQSQSVFGPREMVNPRGNALPSLLSSHGPNDGPFGPRNFNEPPFGQRGSNELLFGQRGCNEPSFGQRGPNEPPFGQRCHKDLPFGQRGHNEPVFGPRGPNESLFGPRGPNEHRFSIRGPNDQPFGQRGLNEPPFAPRGPNDNPFALRNRFDGPFDRESSNVLPFGPREGSDNRFGPRGPNQGPGFNLRGPNPDNFPSGDRSFGPRGFDDHPPFRPQGPDNSFMSRGPSDIRFEQHSGDAGPRNNIPSLLSFKFDEPMNFNEIRDGRMPIDHTGDRSFDRPFRNDNRPPFAPPVIDERGMPIQSNFPGNEFQLDNNKIGPPFGPRSMSLQRDLDDRPIDMLGSNRPIFGPVNSISREPLGDGPLPISDTLSDDRDPFSRRPKTHPGYRRTGPVRQQFCIEKQFNYNHGGGKPDEIFTEFIPSKVIDYGNIRRPTAENYVTPMQCFDYGHGQIKPNVVEHDIYPRMEFKYWVEGEHNLKEYSDGLRAYEDRRKIMAISTHSPRMDAVPIWRYEERKTFNEHRSPWERSEKSKREPLRTMNELRDYKSSRESRDIGRGKRRRDKSWDRDAELYREERIPRSGSEDRTRDKVEKTQKDSNTEYNKNDERSKGNVSRQENPMNTPAEPTIQETSKRDVTNITEKPPKTMELAKSSNITMVGDLLCSPGRQNRPPKIAIILRGPPGSGKSFVAKLIKDKELEQGGSAPRILSLDDYFLTEKEVESKDDNGKKIITKEMVYEYEEAMEPSYIASLVKAFKKNIIDGYFNFIILDSINEKIADYEEMWSFAKTKGFRVFVCEMEMDVQICLKRNIHNRTEDEINKIVDYFEPTPSYHQILDVASLLQDQAIQEVHMEEAESSQSDSKGTDGNDDSQDSQEDQTNSVGVSKWERMEAEDKLDRLDGLAKRKNEGKPQTMEDFLQVPDYYNMEDTSGKKRVRWADLEERKEQEKMRAVGFVVGQTNWNRMMDPTKGGSALTRTKFFNLT